MVEFSVSFFHERILVRVELGVAPAGIHLDQLANLHFHFTSVPRCTPITDGVEVQRNTDGDTRVGLDSKKRFYSEKMRKEWKRGY